MTTLAWVVIASFVSFFFGFFIAAALAVSSSRNSEE